VHNDLSPKNVLTDTTADPARIRIIDWEMAGTGCGLLDLVHLAYGLDPADAEAMLRIYRAELEGSDLLPAAAGELVRLRAGCELHKTVYRLAHCREWGLSGAQMDRLLIDAGTAREAL
jgi:aminoglycoside phosphotransferase (APT) family kinase protein